MVTSSSTFLYLSKRSSSLFLEELSSLSEELEEEEDPFFSFLSFLEDARREKRLLLFIGLGGATTSSKGGMEPSASTVLSTGHDSTEETFCPIFCIKTKKERNRSSSLFYKSKKLTKLKNIYFWKNVEKKKKVWGHKNVWSRLREVEDEKSLEQTTEKEKSDAVFFHFLFTKMISRRGGVSVLEHRCSCGACSQSDLEHRVAVHQNSSLFHLSVKLCFHVLQNMQQRLQVGGIGDFHVQNQKQKENKTNKQKLLLGTWFFF